MALLNYEQRLISGLKNCVSRKLSNVRDIWYETSRVIKYVNFLNYNEHVGLQQPALQQTIALTKFDSSKIINPGELHLTTWD